MPNYRDNFKYEPPSAEEIRKCREEEYKIYEAFEMERKQIQKEKRNQKQLEMQEAIKTPDLPLPDRELCQYEIVRNEIIKERQVAMRASGFFEDIDEYKNEIGFTKKVELKKKKKKIRDRQKVKVQKNITHRQEVEFEIGKEDTGTGKADGLQKDPSMQIFILRIIIYMTVWNRVVRNITSMRASWQLAKFI